MCGSECTTPGGIASPECKGHDMCVCQFGHFACLTEVPPNCGGGTTGITCVALGAAAISWFQGIGNILSNLIFDFFDYLSDFLDPDDPDCSNDPLEDCNNP